MAYSIGFDEGNGDEACFTLFHDGDMRVNAYGKTARLLHDAFLALASERKREARRVEITQLKKKLALLEWGIHVEEAK